MKEFRFAFKQTIPVLCGYIFLGIAFGLLLQQAGYNFIWAFLISTFVYAGSMQFVLISFLGSGIGLLSVVLMTLSVNSRHMFYGISFIDKFKNMGKRYPYMVYSLSDETYSLLCGTNVPENMNENNVLFLISLLDQIYWVAGSVIGAALGSIIPFDITGIDFAMTALFVVIFVEQWLSGKSHFPAVFGFISGLICLIVFGPNKFILPSLIICVLGLTIWGKINNYKEAENR